MQVRVSPAVGALMDEAVTCSLRRNSGYVGVEHLFEALLSDPSALPRCVQPQISVFHAACERAYRDAWRGNLPDVGGEVFYTPRCAAVIHQAAHFAGRFRSPTAEAGHVMLAMLSDAHAAPCRALDAAGCDRGTLVREIQNELSAKPVKPAPVLKTTKVAEDGEDAKPAEPEVPVIETFTRDLTELAHRGELGTAVGRNAEMMQIVEVLARKGKHNVILVGEAGTGKTAIIEGLAQRIAMGQMREVLPQTRILELNLAAMTSGTEYRGRFEAKVFALLEELHRAKDTILFIDEIHLMMGAGSTEGDSMDLANMLKPALSRGELRCIGATTLKEYRKFISSDPAIERRFQMVRVEALSSEATKSVLEWMKESLETHHRVTIQPEAIEAAVQLTQRYLPNRQFPDKAIDVLDQACARVRISTAMRRQNLDTDDAPIPVTPHVVRKVVSLVSAVPVTEITREERARLTDLDARLSRKVIGQDEAIASVSAAVKRARAGMADPDRPDAVMLFLGPTGVGKTELAKQLAKQVFGSSSHLIRFDMSEFMEEHSVAKLIGAPPGYAGHGEEGRLTGAVKDAPFSVLLFDEIEKAHPRVFDLFLPILDEGRLSDADGRVVDFRNCMIVFTSNIGADALKRGDEPAEQTAIFDALRQHFRPELINRIDEVVPFYPLLFEDVRAILKAMIDRVRLRVQDRDIRVRMYQGAYEFLAETGYSPEFGARELRRAVERHIVTPISERLLVGEFGRGDVIEVLVEDGKLVYRKGERRGVPVELA